MTVPAQSGTLFAADLFQGTNNFSYVADPFLSSPLNYDIVFNPPFKTPPTVVAQVITNMPPLYPSVTVTNITASQCTINVAFSNGPPTASFSVIWAAYVITGNA